MREELLSGWAAPSLLRKRKALPSFPIVPPLTAWFVTTSRTKSIPSGSGICTPRRVRSVGGDSWLSRGPPRSLSSPPTSYPHPTIEQGHHPKLQHSLQRGL